jgi:hypothetical protein
MQEPWIPAFMAVTYLRTAERSSSGDHDGSGSEAFTVAWEASLLSRGGLSGRMLSRRVSDMVGCKRCFFLSALVQLKMRARCCGYRSAEAGYIGVQS